MTPRPHTAPTEKLPAPSVGEGGAARLVTVSHASRGAAHPLSEGRTTIGRDRSQALVLDDPAVSRAHCEVVFDGEGVTVVDVGSTNGTYLDGKRLAPDVPAALDVGSHLEVGTFVFRFRWEEGPGAGSRTEAVRDPVWRIRMLGPDIKVTTRGRPDVVPKGRGARLLALLVAARGPLHVDYVVESLWPEVRPDVGRKRLRCVLHRLRRPLGFRLDGPVRVADGLVRFDRSDEVAVDVWDFLDGIDGDASEQVVALALYEGPFCSQQLAYEDFACDFRRELERRLVAVATRVLQAALAGDDLGPDVQASARRLWALAPADEPLAAAAIAVMARSGLRGEAWDMLARSVESLDDVGLPAVDLRERTQDVLA